LLGRGYEPPFAERLCGDISIPIYGMNMVNYEIYRIILRQKISSIFVFGELKRTILEILVFNS
jgi:hypothetical protein